MDVLFLDGHIVWSGGWAVTTIAVLLSQDGEEKAPHLRLLAKIKVDDACAIMSVEGVDYTLRADDLGVRLVRSLYNAGDMERNRALHDTAESMRTNFGLRLRRISEKHIRPIAA